MSGSHDQTAAGDTTGASSASSSTGRSGRQTANETCSSCGTTTTPVWRRDGQGGLHCNACSLYIKTKGKPRPIHLESYTVKRRRARPSSRQITAEEASTNNDSKNTAAAVPYPIVSRQASSYAESGRDGRTGNRLCASYPYRDRSAERQTQRHQSQITTLDLPMPPLPSLTTSTSMLETRILPPPRSTNIPHYQQRRRDSN